MQTILPPAKPLPFFKCMDLLSTVISLISFVWMTTLLPKLLRSSTLSTQCQTFAPLGSQYRQRHSSPYTTVIHTVNLLHNQYLSHIQHRRITGQASTIHVSDLLRVLLHIRDVDLSTINRLGAPAS